ncbi:MAG TPA: hypothetical protein VF576_13295, partial [Rubricoccaceae bacterium]
ADEAAPEWAPPENPWEPEAPPEPDYAPVEPDRPGLRSDIEPADRIRPTRPSTGRTIRPLGAGDPAGDRKE